MAESVKPETYTHSGPCTAFLLFLKSRISVQMGAAASAYLVMAASEK